jgi:hypothetical protein|tara:strand:- start:1172 stop:1846 length:675 start_codon:yes stop_codon:yes gene_type:complete
MDDNTIVNTETVTTGVQDSGASQDKIQEAASFSQEDVDKIVAKRLKQVQKKYEGINVDEYQQLKSLQERVEEQELMDRKDFDVLLKKTKAKYDDEVVTLKSQLESVKIDGALIDAASKQKGIAPEQISKLLRDSVKLNSTGEVVINDKDGQVRYNDEATPMTVEQLVGEFLDTNTFYRAAGPSGTQSEGNVSIADKQKFDLGSLDMTNPEHRKIYKQMKASGKL